MLKIQRSANGSVVFALSGRIEADDVTELQRLFELESASRHLVLDLKDVTLADRDAVSFLMRCEENGIRIKNCPPYIREWIEREKGTQQSVKKPSQRKRSAHRHSE